MFRSDVVECLHDTLLHAFQPTDVDVSIGVLQQHRQVVGAFTQEVLDVSLGLIRGARERQIRVDEILR